MKNDKKTTPTDQVEVVEKSTAEILHKEIVPQENSIVNFNVESLMAKAIEHGLSPETMEKFLAMRMQLKAEWAREQYNKAMAAFQAECPTIEKTKDGGRTKSGQVAYKYAPLESIVEQVKELLNKNGFSYSTSMEVLPNGVKVCVRTTHIDGHTEESCMQVPLGTVTGVMSASQQTAAAQTFAKRYAFCNAFGILTGDEDNDGANIPESENNAPAGMTTSQGSVKEYTTATPKQKEFIAKLCKEKGISPVQLKELVITHNTPSKLIDYLLSNKKEDMPLPVIEQEPVLSDADVADIPF